MMLMHKIVQILLTGLSNIIYENELESLHNLITLIL